MHYAIRQKILFIFVIFISIALPFTAWATCEQPVATLVSVEGSITTRSADEPAWRSASRDAPLCQGDYVRVARNSRGALHFSAADTVVRLDQNTTLQIVAPPSGEESIAVEIQSGIANFLSRVKRHLRIGTPFMNGSIEGTEFMVSVSAEHAQLDLYEGQVLVANDLGQLRLSGRQSARAVRGAAPQRYTLLHPEDAVQWALHYQPMLAALLASRTRELASDQAELFRRAVELLGRGAAAGAFAAVNGVAPDQRGAAYFVLRAALYLSVGRVQQAESDLAAAGSLDADAQSIAAVIALGRNQKQTALTLAQEATKSAPDRPLPWLALSYARQAQFDLAGAQQALGRGIAADPDNGLLRARQAELSLAQGDLDGALEQAAKAQELAPELALVQRTLGFAELLQIRIPDAEHAFRQAITLDQSDPLARLGLGLALIRQGQLEAGRSQLEIAVALSPRDSLLRSYLGKAYYAEKRDSKAQTQYDLAAEIDPKDPTPWLYTGILLQQSNRPVEALEALERSTELNDNRAVYRSKLLLDADAAARSASQGQTYRELGFEQLALLQGWQSTATAPDDYSGHRLLADVYGVLPRHEEGRVSELLQAQLLQPLNANPVQPLMAETRLLVPEGLTPSAVGLNEYSRLFERNGANAWLSGMLGNHDAWGDEVLASGLNDRTAFSVGQYHYDIQGGGGIVPQSQDILVGFMQHQLTPATSVQGELRYTDTDEGPYEVPLSVPVQDQDLSRSARLGLRHQWSPGAVLIASFIYQDLNQYTRSYGQFIPDDPGSLVESDGWGSDTGWSAELRQDWRGDGLRISAGIGFFDLDQDHRISAASSFSGEVDGLPGVYLFETELDDAAKNRFAQAYTYVWWDLAPQWELNLGLSYDYLKESQDVTETTSFGFRSESPPLEIPLDLTADDGASSRTKGQLNPKLGVVWRPWEDTILRAAAFRSLRRPKAMKRTIEPTQVAGFNQMFDGLQGEEFWRYGIGIDKRFSQRLLAGLELSRRDRSYLETDLGYEDTEFSQNERFGRAYLYWTPTSRVSATAEYFYEQQVIGGEEVDDITHRLPLSLAYFHPAGFYGRLRGSYVEQSGNWPERFGERQSEKFWNCDLELGYRLPKRKGLISLQVNNLFDQALDYRETDKNHPLFVAERTLTLRASIRF